MLEWSKTYENINVEEHKLLNGRILVRMPTILEKDVIQKKGKIIEITGLEIQGYVNDSIENHIRKLQREMTKGELIKISPTAFPDNIEEKPEIGDMVFFFPYSGNIYLSDDEYLYRNMSYKDLTGFEKLKK